MKRLLLTDSEQNRLLQDDINKKILRNLIDKELSVSDLARVLGTPVVKTWRRVKILEEHGLVEQSGRALVANLEKKLYRSTAVSYRSEDSFELEPKNKPVVKAYQKFKQIRSDLIGLVQKANEVPDDASPSDYALAIDLYAMCTIYLKAETQVRMQSILKDIAESGILNFSMRS